MIKALKKSKIVILKNHGVFAIADDFWDGFSLIEVIESQAKLNVLLKCMEK